MSASDGGPYGGFGWRMGPTGNWSFTAPGHSWQTGDRPPARKGWEPFFVAHYGQRFTRWTYRRRAA